MELEGLDIVQMDEKYEDSSVRYLQTDENGELVAGEKYGEGRS